MPMSFYRYSALICERLLASKICLLIDAAVFSGFSVTLLASLPSLYDAIFLLLSATAFAGMFLFASLRCCFEICDMPAALPLSNAFFFFRAWRCCFRCADADARCFRYCFAISAPQRHALFLRCFAFAYVDARSLPLCFRLIFYFLRDGFFFDERCFMRAFLFALFSLRMARCFFCYFLLLLISFHADMLCHFIMASPLMMPRAWFSSASLAWDWLDDNLMIFRAHTRRWRAALLAAACRQLSYFRDTLLCHTVHAICSLFRFDFFC